MSDISITGDNFPLPYVPPEPEPAVEGEGEGEGGGEEVAGEGEVEGDEGAASSRKVEAPSCFVRSGPFEHVAAFL